MLMFFIISFKFLLNSFTRYWSAPFIFRSTRHELDIAMRSRSRISSRHEAQTSRSQRFETPEVSGSENLFA